MTSPLDLCQEGEVGRTRSVNNLSKNSNGEKRSDMKKTITKKRYNASLSFNARAAFVLLFLLVALLLNFRMLSDMTSGVATQQVNENGMRDFRPLVGLLVPVPPREDITSSNITESLLCGSMLTSLIESLNCEFRYLVVVGYWSGDKTLDKDEGIADLKAWFAKEVSAPMRQKNFEVGILTWKVTNSTVAEYFVHEELVSSTWLEYAVAKLKHAWNRIIGLDLIENRDAVVKNSAYATMVNLLARQAYYAGADFLYRVSDETIFLGRWAKSYASMLLSSGHPYGVVGPASHRSGSSNYLLRHHFVHRTHLNIFSMNFYPVGLEDWWVDHWMSRVYGSRRSYISRYIKASFPPSVKSNYTVVNSAGYIKAWVNASQSDLHRWIAKFYHQNISRAVAVQNNYVSGVGMSSMRTISLQPEHMGLQLECRANGRGISPRFQKCIDIKDRYRLKYVGDLIKWSHRMPFEDKIFWQENNCSSIAMDVMANENSYFYQNKRPYGRGKDRRKVVLESRKLVNCTGAGEAGEKASRLPLIAIMSAATSRGIRRPSNNTISLLRIMLPTLAPSLDCGFRYLVLLGVDQGDFFFDTSEGRAALLAWFASNVQSVLAERAVDIQLRLLAVANPAQKPGPVFLAIAREAYSLGADYFYRVNDDTEFIERWPEVFVTALTSLGPPYGVIGPRSFNTDNRILTHDFVHRTHMDLFSGEYYPPELQDWWMDDWISHVYGPNRTLMTKAVTIYHHTMAHGKRYKVNFDHLEMLEPLVEKGRQKVLDWMRANGISGDDSRISDANLRYYTSPGVTETYYPIECNYRRVFCAP